MFGFSTSKSSGSSITKRLILSEVAQVFDPLGLLSPVVIRAKMLLQELWLEKLSWDEELSAAVAHKWTSLRGELAELTKIKVPRWLRMRGGSVVEFHGFSDASQLAMAAVVYCRILSTETERSVTLVCSKTKVAPLKRLTIPRLELSAAVMLTKLLHHVRLSLKMTETKCFLWTDSSVTLTWVKSHPSRWKDFVRNRVSTVQALLPAATWMFVPGKQNPADCASRGLTTENFVSHPLWWTGPPWLGGSSDSWPEQKIKISESVELEERPGLTLAAVIEDQPVVWDLVNRYSDLTRLLRITAVLLRAAARMRDIPNTSLVNQLQPADLELARAVWVKIIQAAYFKSELRALTQGQSLSRSHPLTRLTAYIDRDGVLRVGGRLRHSQLDSECKHPAILPRDSPFNRLVIEHAHQRTLHGGTRLTLASVREKYWLIGGRVPVRAHVLRCIKCARQRAERAQQLMGQLPSPRVTSSDAFSFSGVDYAGPISLKTRKGRGASTYKGWLCVFVCFSSSAVHLEVVTDYSKDAFLSAFRRFTGRRGPCTDLYSDCGTTFAGANAELQRLFTAGTRESMALGADLTADETTWHFNPPAAPHMGGKWEAAVKSVKFHLRRTIGEICLTYEEMTTLLVQIEAVLNSRPLEPLSEDPDDLSALTPGHFLCHRALRTIPEPSLLHLNSARLSRWQLIQQRLQHFWSRWSAEYLQRLQAISKWHHPQNRLKVGSLVLITDERFPPSKWPLARVTRLHPGGDGLTRVVTLRTAATTLTRPVAKLALLPINSAEESEVVVDSVPDGGENVGAIAS